MIGTAISTLARLVVLALAIGQGVTSGVLFRGRDNHPDLFTGTTPLVPADFAFFIWAPIFAMTALFGLYQILPGRARDPALPLISTAGAVGFAGCIGWLFAARDEPSLTVPIILCMLIAMIVAFVAAERADQGHDNRSFSALVTSPFALYAGWLTVAAAANAAELAAGQGTDPMGDATTFHTVLLLGSIAVAVIAGILGRFHPLYTGAVIWALAGVALRNQPGDGSFLVFSIAIAAGLALLALTIAVRVRPR